MKKRKEKSYLYVKLIFVLLYWVVMQDFVLAFLYKSINSKLIVNLLFYSKDILFIFLMTYAICKKKYPYFILIPFVGFVCCIIFSSVLAGISFGITLSTLLQSIRNVILLFGFVIIGYAIPNVESFKSRIVNKYFPFLVFCAAVGILEYLLDIFIGTKKFWLDIIGITEYYTDIKGQAGRLVFGFPGNFYGDYGLGYFAQKRLVGFWMGPLTSAYVLLVPTVYYFISVIKAKKIGFKALLRLLILIVSIYLTHTRAILIVFLLIAFISVMKELYRRLDLSKFMLVIVLGIILLAVVIIINRNKFLSVLFDGSTAGHLESLLGAISYIGLKLFGSGIGALGIGGLVGTESAYLTVLGNMGIIGLILYVIPILYAAARLLKANSKNNFDVTIFYCLICYAITGFISEQLFAYTSLAPFYLLLGAVLSQKCQVKQKKSINLPTINNKSAEVVA